MVTIIEERLHGAQFKNESKGNILYMKGLEGIYNQLRELLRQAYNKGFNNGRYSGYCEGLRRGFEEGLKEASIKQYKWEGKEIEGSKTQGI